MAAKRIQHGDQVRAAFGVAAAPQQQNAFPGPGNGQREPLRRAAAQPERLYIHDGAADREAR